MTNFATAHDVWQYRQRPLDAIFAPKSVAVIGATERRGSVGRTIVWNLMTNAFGGVIYPVNPTRSSVLGIKAYPSINEIGEPVDLAVIVTPAPTVPGIIQECVTAGVKGAIIISAGFKERGPDGQALETEILSIARQGGLRIIGPNCLGVMNPITGLNATFAAQMARPGSVGFISQSGALCTSILDWSIQENVGFSAFVSIGSMMDIGWGDLIDYLGHDPNTKSIVIYMESVGDARAFMSAAREVALTKPIIVIKPGRTQAAAAAAASHTGSLTGSDDVLETAFQRCGVLRVNRISDLFNMSEVLSKQPRPRGPRLTIITNAGGPGVLATDALISNGGQLAPISPATEEALNKVLPPHWSHNNPIDILGDAGRQRYAEAVDIAANEPESDGLLVILTPQSMTWPTQTAEELAHYAKNYNKPILASWMGGSDVRNGELSLNHAGIPTFKYPDTAAQMFTYMWQYSQRLRSLYETPSTPNNLSQDNLDQQDTAQQEIESLLTSIRASGRTILTEYESKQVLAAYNVDTVTTRLATTPDEAVAIAAEIGYPVVLKLNSETITHKTDVQGVQLNLADETAVRQAYTLIKDNVDKHGDQYAHGHHDQPHFLGVTVQPMINLEGYELIVGSSPDPQFGPILLFGSGGTLVEVFKDSALALPPLNSTLARRMMEKTKIYTALKGVRGRPPVALDDLEHLLVNFSQLVAEQPLIKEIDINPLLASPDRILALDARVLLYAPDEPLGPPLAIRPYPAQYTTTFTLKNDEQLIARPLRPEDEPAMVTFHEQLSAKSVYMRYFQSLQFDERTTHERLTRICFIDYDRQMALAVTRINPDTNKPEIVAVGRLSRHQSHPQIAEFAMLIIDAYHGQGLGTLLLKHLLTIARSENIKQVEAYMLPDNGGMKHICQKLGFKITWEDDLVKAIITL
ncbi:MAG TPA: bifunctional acetate--CoA ligase family protein/GNAT family N-acetyltransferase [Anaerolineae bacterium]|nr:bifunctional acetate--CoA ligase family protein/GNAT family N-acetyltransferase [Anaerolineae bacterium]